MANQQEHKLDAEISAEFPSINMDGSFSQMSLWFTSVLGQRLLQVESELIEGLLTRRFGYHLLQIGCSNVELFQASPIGHKFSIAGDKHSITQVIGKGESLPLASESIDLVILHHSLDFAEDKRQLLREVSRVLIAGGNLIILGFNPYSAWGVRNKFSFNRQLPWHGKLISPYRLTDWLKMLEFRTQKVQFGFYNLPINSPGVLKISAFGNTLASRLNWPTGGVYTLSAKKESLPLTPIKGDWKRFSKPSVGIPITENRIKQRRSTRVIGNVDDNRIK